MFVSRATHKQLLEAEKAHFEQLLAQEQRHHAELQENLQRIIRNLKAERDAYRSQLWEKREGVSYDQSIEAAAPPMTEAEQFRQWRQSLSEDDRILLADWEQTMIQSGEREEDLPKLWLQVNGWKTPLLALMQ